MLKKHKKIRNRCLLKAYGLNSKKMVYAYKTNQKEYAPKN